MTTEEVIAELTSCLALQNEIADKHLELASRYKAVLEAARGLRGEQIAVRIDGQLYQLIRVDAATDEMRSQMEICRKLKGFYGGYRLVKAGQVYE